MKRQHFDMTGVALSGFCFLHCLALPLLAGALPVGLGFAHDERVHIVVLVLAMAAAWFAFRGAFTGRNPRRPLALLAIVGLALIGIALFVPDEIEALVSVAGGACLAIAHLLNFLRARRQHAARHKHPSTVAATESDMADAA